MSWARLLAADIGHSGEVPKTRESRRDAGLTDDEITAAGFARSAFLNLRRTLHSSLSLAMRDR